MTSHTYDTVILGDRAGYVALAFGRGPHRDERGTYRHREWTETRYTWPDEAAMMRAEIDREQATGEPVDCYVCPAVRFTDRRRRGDALPPMVCWADLDTNPADPGLFATLDPYVIASGQPGHRHVYIPLSESVPLSAHAQLNKALAHRLGGDAKWSDESLLRLPGTHNHKTTPPSPVAEPGEWGGTVWTPASLADLLGVDFNESTNDGTPRLTSVPRTGAGAVERETPPDPLPANVRRALDNPDTLDRSKAHARLVAACYDAGFTQGQAVSLVSGYGPSVDKYGNRITDEIARWWGKVRADHTQPAPVVPLAVNGSAALAPNTSTLADTDAHRGQTRIAYRVVAEHGHRLRFAHGLGWLVWDGCRWAPDIDGEPWRAVLTTTRAAMVEAVGLGKDDRDALLADVRKVESANGVRGVLDLAATMEPIAVAAAQLDADPQLFNTTNGTLDLHTGELRDADPADLITKVAGCAYQVDAYSPRFATFLETVLPDASVRDFTQRLCGYALLGEVREHVLPICSGTGRNGKGTLLDAVRKAFGNYGMTVEPELLMETGPRHSTEQTDLRGARLVVTSETNEGRPLAAATVKRLTGGDAIRARRMRQDTIEFEPSHTLAMITNYKPTVSGDDAAMWRRIRVIPFDVTIPEADADAGLPAALASELPAVLAWCVQGYRRYLVDGLTAPESVTARTDEYRSDNDALGRFLDERTITNEYGRTPAGELFSAWAAWCAHNGETAGTRNAFNDAMNRHGYASRKSNGRMVYAELLMATEGDDDAKMDGRDVFAGHATYGETWGDVAPNFSTCARQAGYI